MALALGALTVCGGNKKASGSAVETKVTSSGKAIFRTVDEIKKPGMIRIGVFTDKAPFGHVDANGVNRGHGVVYVQRITQDFGVKAKFTSLDPAARTEYANIGKVDIIFANSTATKERAERIDSVKPYMKVALGVVSSGKTVIHSVDELEGKTLIIAKGTTAETYFEKNYPEVKLRKYDAYADAYNALLDGRGDAFSVDNTGVIAQAKANPGFEVGIDSPGDYDTIAAAVAGGNETPPNFLNEEIVMLGKENFFHKDHDEMLKPAFGDAANSDTIVVKGGELSDTKQ